MNKQIQHVCPSIYLLNNKKKLILSLHSTLHDFSKRFMDNGHTKRLMYIKQINKNLILHLTQILFNTTTLRIKIEPKKTHQIEFQSVISSTNHNTNLIVVTSRNSQYFSIPVFSIPSPINNKNWIYFSYTIELLKLLLLLLKINP